jgi:tetratricopeptide (TPR) repeat protein
LAPLRNHPDPLIRYRALLELARAAFRDAPQGHPQLIPEPLREALAVPLVPTRLKADAYFLQGFQLLGQRQAEPARVVLEHAVRLDPDFMEARWQLLQAQLETRPPRIEVLGPNDACLTYLQRLGNNIQQIGLLAEDANQFLDLARHLERVVGAGSPLRAFTIAYALLLAGDSEHAATMFERATAATRPGSCLGLFAKGLGALAEKRLGGA